MLAFLLSRVLQSAVVLLVVAMIAFLMFRFAGDPLNQIVSIDTPPAELARLRQELGLNDPLPYQIGRFLLGILRFDFGIS